VDIYTKFLIDKNKLVKLEAYKNIGPFMYNIKENVPNSIIIFYLKMLNKEIVNQFNADEVYFF